MSESAQPRASPVRPVFGTGSAVVGPQGTGVGRRRYEGTPVLNYIDPLPYTRCAGISIFGEKRNNKKKETSREKEGKEAPLGAEGWKDIFQLLKEQGKKIEMLGRAISHPGCDA